MTADVLRWSEYPSMPWKNGGGVTREVASGAVQASPAPAESAGGFDWDWDWRVSVTEVDSGGAFSAFPGVDRVSTLVEGERLALTVAGTPHRAGALSPIAYPGDAPTYGRLEAGPVRNLNVMTRRGRATAEVRVVPVAAARELACAAGETLLVMAVTEGVAVGGAEGRETALGRLDCVRLDCVRRRGPAVLTLRGEGTVAAVRISAAR